MSVVASGSRPDWPRVLATGVLVGAAAILLVSLFSAAGSEKLGHDLRAAYLPAAEAVRSGESPYATPTDRSVAEGTAYVYPPQLAVLLVPLTFVSRDVAAFLGFLAALAALAGALWVVGARDLRCYAAIPLWTPAWNALEMANVSAFLALALAVAWRFRERVWEPAFALGLAISAKLVLWPLLVWEAGRGRFRATVLAILVGAGLTTASWALVGLAGFEEYPDLLRRLSEAQAGSSYSFVGIAAALGLGDGAGRLISVVVGGVLVAGCAATARAGDDLRSFTLAIGAALALSPIVWQHYLVLLLVPLAVARPQFSPIWLTPLVLWVSPRAGHGGGIEPLLPLLVAAVLVAVVVRPRKAAAMREIV